MMHTHQLIAGCLATAMLASGCAREDADDNARRAAAEVRAAAAQAGDTLADRWLTTKIQAQYFADEDIKALAAYYASQPPPQLATVASPKPRVGTRPAGAGSK